MTTVVGGGVLTLSLPQTLSHDMVSSTTTQSPERTTDPMAATLASARRTQDPVRRATVAAEIAHEAQAEAAAARRRRDMAIVTLHRVQGWPPVKIQRIALVSPVLFWRIIHRVGQVPLMSEPAEVVAEREGAATRRYDALAKEAGEVRDEAIVDAILNHGVRNADLMRATKLTSARIAQIKAGTR